MIAARTVVASVVSMPARPILPNIATNAANPADSIAKKAQEYIVYLSYKIILCITLINQPRNSFFNPFTLLYIRINEELHFR